MKKNKYRVLFIEPNFEQAERPGFDEFMEPLGLAYVARATYENGHTVKIMQQFDLSVNEVVKYILKYKPDIVGMSFVTKYFNNAVNIIKILKQKSPKLLTIAGGAHATGYPEITAKYFDYVVKGEGESTFVKLLDIIEDKAEPDIAGIAFYNNEGLFRDNGNSIRNDFIYKFPFRETLDFTKYTGIGNGPPPIPKVGFASLIFVKACRFNCTFCQNANMWMEPGGKKVKTVTRDIDDVIEEMIYLYNQGIGYVWFQDPDFPLYNRPLMIAFLKRKQEKVPNLKFSFMTRVDNIYKGNNIEESRELLQLLKDAGCHMIGMGIESSNHEIMKKTTKVIKEPSLHITIDEIYNVGIIPVGFFMIGFSHETEESVLNTYKFAKSLKFLRYRFGIFYPYRGTHDNNVELEWLEEEENTFDKSNHEHQVIKCEMEDYKIEKYFKKFNKEIYTENEYQLRLNYFIVEHPEMKQTMENWKQTLEVNQ